MSRKVCFSGCDRDRAEIDLEAVGPRATQPRLSPRPVPAPPLFAEALATSFGDRDRILKLDEPAPGMSHRCLDGDDHAGLQRPSCVVGLVRHRSIVNLAWRFMTDEAHAMRRKIQIGSVGRGVQGLVRRPENLGPYGAAADRAACLLLDLLDYAEKVNKLGVWLAQNAIRHKSPI